MLSLAVYFFTARVLYRDRFIRTTKWWVCLVAAVLALAWSYAETEDILVVAIFWGAIFLWARWRVRRVA